ncbi:MAG: ORF6N domain-containing protein [Nitrospinae bacterium]|nr:ORF6N domain-containing protein [Nitrospinota bacterium]
MDYMFQLTKREFDDLRSQIVISNRGGRRYLPYAFTEQGVGMLSSVLRSERSVHKWRTGTLELPLLGSYGASPLQGGSRTAPTQTSSVGVETPGKLRLLRGGDSHNLPIPIPF